MLAWYSGTIQRAGLRAYCAVVACKSRFPPQLNVPVKLMMLLDVLNASRRSKPVNRHERVLQVDRLGPCAPLHNAWRKRQLQWSQSFLNSYYDVVFIVVFLHVPPSRCRRTRRTRKHG